MAKQTFTTGQVLTAAQMTSLQANDYNQTVSAKTASYVLVAADAGTTITMNSGSATTITVNTALFTAGDTLRIQNIGAGACVVTAGTATVTSAGSLSIPQWGGGTLYFTTSAAAVYFPNATVPGLVCVKPETTFSAVASVNIDSVFTSSYTNYALLVNFTGTTGSAVTLQMRVGGAAATTNYNYQRITAAGTTSTTTRVLSASSLDLGIGSTGSFNETLNLNIFQPAIATPTSFNNFFGAADTSYGFPSFYIQNSNHATATAYDGLALTIATGSMSGSYTVYGYSKVAS